MLDTVLLYENIDSFWPTKRSAEEKIKEKEAISSVIKTQVQADSLKTKLEILAVDKPKKLPSLLSVILGIDKHPFKPILIPVLSQEETEPEEDNETDRTFEEIYNNWPENDIPQNKKFAKVAFIAASRQRSLEDIKKACNKYIEDMSNPAKASSHILGMKRFVSDDDIFETWLQKASVISSNYDYDYFNAVYARYPEFVDKETPKLREESAFFYKRFVKEEECVDFFCAVREYNSERRETIKSQQLFDNYNPENDAKYTKRFKTFVAEWKRVKPKEYLPRLLEAPLLQALRKRAIKYDAVYPQEAFYSALTYNCLLTDENGGYKGSVFVVTKMLEDICNSLTSGENSANIVVKIEPDYSLVSEVIAMVKAEVKKMPIKGTPIESQ